MDLRAVPRSRFSRARALCTLLPSATHHAASRRVPIKVQDRPCLGTPQPPLSSSSSHRFNRRDHLRFVVSLLRFSVAVLVRARPPLPLRLPARRIDISTSPPVRQRVSPCHCHREQQRQARARAASHLGGFSHGRAPAVHARARDGIFACSRHEKRHPSSSSARPLSPPPRPQRPRDHSASPSIPTSRPRPRTRPVTTSSVGSDEALLIKQRSSELSSLHSSVIPAFVCLYCLVLPPVHGSFSKPTPTSSNTVTSLLCQFHTPPPHPARDPRRKAPRRPAQSIVKAHCAVSPLCPGFDEKGSLHIIRQSAKIQSHGVDLVRCTGRRPGRTCSF